MTEFWIQENDKYMLNDLCNIIDGRGNRGQLFKLSVGHKVIDNSGLEPSLPEHA